MLCVYYSTKLVVLKGLSSRTCHGNLRWTVLMMNEQRLITLVVERHDDTDKHDTTTPRVGGTTRRTTCGRDGQSRLDSASGSTMACTHCRTSRNECMRPDAIVVALDSTRGWSCYMHAHVAMVIRLDSSTCSLRYRVGVRWSDLSRPMAGATACRRSGVGIGCALPRRNGEAT